MRVEKQQRQREKNAVHRLLLRSGAREQFSYLCNRERSAIRVQSFRVHPAAGASAEACRDGGDQEHRHTHLAVQPS